MTCQCVVCKRSRNIRETVRDGNREQLVELISVLHNELLSVEMDEEWCRAIIAGTWPGADDAIARARATPAGKTESA